MDKDSVILKYEEGRTDKIEVGIKDLSERSDNHEKKLVALEERIKRLYERKGMKMPSTNISDLKNQNERHSSIKMTTSREYSNDLSYDELFLEAKDNLVSRGFDVENLTVDSLLTEEEIWQIEEKLDRPVPMREKWNKNDFAVVFIAAAIGSLADILLSSRGNPFTGTSSDFSKWLNNFHKHAGGAPIDYQGPNFGGGFHRGLSKGHDILRFIEGISMFKNGQFEAIRYENGIARMVISTVNQNGKPYEQLPVIEAIIRYAQHMFADLLSTCSLPFPGSSFLVESGSRELRVFAADMYKNGFNIKNIMCQSISTIIIEVILRIYFSIQSVKKYKDSVELKEDYSNHDAIKAFFKPANTQKLDEMLLTSHAIVTAVNIGKVIINKAPWEINVTEIMSVVKYGIKVVKASSKRDPEFEKLMRNSKEIHEGWISLEQTILTDERSILYDYEDLIIGTD